MDKREPIELLYLQSFRAPVNKVFKSHQGSGVACHEQKVVVPNIFPQKEFGFS